MMFWAYMLRCNDGTYYVGHTDSLERRIGQHQIGEIAGYTHTRRPVELVWSQDFPTRLEALEAERQLKGWGKKKKEALIAGDWAAVRVLASRAKVLRDATSPGSAAPQDERKRVDDQFIAVRPEEGLSEGEGPSRRTGAGQTPPPPIIILVRPQLGENIGKAARAMLNFGLTELRLVSPRDGWPNPQAGPAASGADSVIANAQVFETVEAATADCTHIYATTVRKRGVTKPVVTPEAAATAIHTGNERAAILFGPERAGLETDDVALARTIITVPINPEFGSLNLAQAVLVVAYEWSKTQTLAMPPLTDAEPPAPQGELDGLWVHLDTMLTDVGFYFPPDKVPTIRRAIRTILTKPGWNALEVRTLRGVLTALQKPRPRS